jgi:hypothetical protein
MTRVGTDRSRRDHAPEVRAGRIVKPPDLERPRPRWGWPRIPGLLSEHLSRDSRLCHWGATCFRAPFPSIPQWFLFPGRTGHPPRSLGWSPVVPGNFGKESARNETRFLKSPHRGPGEGTDREWAGRARTLLLACRRGHKYIIGSGFWIVLAFRPVFLMSGKEVGVNGALGEYENERTVNSAVLLGIRSLALCAGPSPR